MLALIFAGCAAPKHAHLFRVFRDLDELHTPPERSASPDGRGRRLSAHTHSATVDLADTRLELTYDAVAHERHALRLLEPALAPHIHSIHCANATHVRVRGEIELPALLADRLRDGGDGGIVMTGACTSEEEPTASRPFYCRVARVAARCDSCGEITLETEPIGLHDAFDSLKLAFRWSPPRTRTPRAQAAPPPPAPPPPLQHAGRRRLFLSKIGDALNDLGEGLVDAGGKLLDKAGKVASGLVGAIVGGVGGALDGMGDSLPEAVKGHWESLVDTLKAFFDGFSLHVEPSLNLLVRHRGLGRPPRPWRHQHRPPGAHPQAARLRRRRWIVEARRGATAAAAAAQRVPAGASPDGARRGKPPVQRAALRLLIFLT